MNRIVFSIAGVLALSSATLAPRASAQTRSATPARAPVLPRTRVERGITIYAHDAAALTRAPQWTLDAKPLLVAGAVRDSDFDLSGVFDVQLLSDGRLVTLAMNGAKLVVYATDGRAPRAIGRFGRAPGEFTSPTGLLRLSGDTLVVIDQGNDRISWIHVNAGVVRSSPFDPKPRPRFIRPVGALPGGRWVVVDGEPPAAKPGTITRSMAHVALLNAKGDSKPVVDIPDLEWVHVKAPRKSLETDGAHLLYFSRRAHVVVRDSQILTGDGDGYVIRIRNSEGLELARTQLDVARRPVTREMRAAAVTRALARLRGPGRAGLPFPEKSERDARDDRSADLLPPYESLHTTPNGTLWVVDAFASTDTAWSATAFRRDGAIIGRLGASRTELPITFGDDRIVLRTVDADGVVAFVVRRIRR